MEGHANSSEFANEILKDSERIQRIQKILISSVFVIQMTKLYPSDVISGFSRTEAGDVRYGDFQHIASHRLRQKVRHQMAGRGHDGVRDFKILLAYTKRSSYEGEIRM
jgi:hypothetical protein